MIKLAWHFHIRDVTVHNRIQPPASLHNDHLHSICGCTSAKLVSFAKPKYHNESCQLRLKGIGIRYAEKVKTRVHVWEEEYIMYKYKNE